MALDFVRRRSLRHMELVLFDLPATINAVLSSVDYARERKTARQLGADTHLIKLADFSGLVRIAEDLRQRWLEPPPHQLAA